MICIGDDADFGYCVCCSLIFFLNLSFELVSDILICINSYCWGHYPFRWNSKGRKESTRARSYNLHVQTIRRRGKRYVSLSLSNISRLTLCSFALKWITVSHCLTGEFDMQIAAKEIDELWMEYEENSTAEAKIVKDFDKV